MALSSGFFNSFDGDRTYDARDFSEYFKGLVTNGCFPNDTGFLVTANPEPIGSNPPSVIIKPGKAFFDGLWTINPADYTYTMGPSQQISPGMFHLIFLEFNNTDQVRDVLIKHVTGATPALPANSNDKFHLPLALVTDKQNVQPGANDIEDTRMYAGVSGTGITTPSIVDGAITQPKLADGAVATEKIANLAVSSIKIAHGAVTATKLGLLSVINTRIADKAISFSKLGGEIFRAEGKSSYSWDNLTDTTVSVGSGSSTEYTHTTSMPRLLSINLTRNVIMYVIGNVTIDYDRNSEQPIIGLAIFDTASSSFTNKTTQNIRTLGSGRILDIGTTRRVTIPVNCILPLTSSGTHNLRLGIGSSSSGAHRIVGSRTHISAFVLPR